MFSTLFNKNIGLIYIKSSNKNLFLHIIREQDKLLLKTLSFGIYGFKGRRKNTAFSIITLASNAATYLLTHNYSYLSLIFNSSCYLQRQLLIKILLTTSIKEKTLQLLSIQDQTEVPFNGCRLTKKKSR
uniref:30S ribosomal protein S11 n=1 Tax=Nephromyces sp. ex Molgula occidentalis TaxID=2544991 RepID=A0A5C1H7V7_9APIC|nr:30S ribosomal protein S11 [Nephromyces sp. ex Molgula occidentalis]